MSKSPFLYFAAALAFSGASVYVCLVGSVSYYEMKYGRDLVFTGLSKYVLAASLALVAIGFLRIVKERLSPYDIVERGDKKLIPFMLAMLLAILSYCLEAGLL